MTTLIFPYDTLTGTMELSVSRAEAQVENGYVEISGESLNHDNRTLDVTACEDYSGTREVRLELDITIPKSEYVHLHEVSGPLSVVVVVYCRSTNTRVSVSALQSQIDQTNWSRSLVLPRNYLRESIQIKAILTGRAGGLDCRLLGESEPWIVYFDESAASTIRGALPVKWVDFTSDESRPFFKSYANEPWYADLTEKAPTVYLNSSFKYLPELFTEGTSRSPELVALNEAQRTAIAKEIWIAMFHASLAQIVPGEDGGDPSWPEGWKAEVLKRILPRVYPNVDENQALRLADDARASEGVEWIESAALGVIGRDIVKEGKNLRKALSAVMAQKEEQHG